MNRLLLAPLILALGSPVQAGKKLMDLNYPDNFWGAENTSVKTTKQIETEFAKTYCQKVKDNKSQINCVKFLSPYGESLRKVKEPFWLKFCLPMTGPGIYDIENGKIPIPNNEYILSLSKCLRANAKVKTPASVFGMINTSSSNGINQAILSTKTHNGKTYIASRVCEEGRSMQWMTYPGFLGIGGRVEELGCMNRLEHEAYMRNYRARIDSRPVIINNPAPTYTQPQRTYPIPNNYDFGY